MGSLARHNSCHAPLVSQLREQVEEGHMKPRTFKRRIAAISSLYRWASEPSRSSVAGVLRNPIPPRSLLHVPLIRKSPRLLDFGAYVSNPIELTIYQVFVSQKLSLDFSIACTIFSAANEKRFVLFARWQPS